MDLADVENDLRAHLHRQATPRAPEGLVKRTRALHRQRRRTQAGVVATGVAVALLFGGVPALRAALPQPDRSDVAAPSAPASAPRTSLYDLPPRGSLAGDQDWLAGVAALDWGTDDAGQLDPPVDSHRVVYAGDVSTGRVALVLGEDGSELSSIWFTGPTGATPAEMTPATSPQQTFPDLPQLLVDVAAPADRSGVLIAVSRPGDRFSYSPGVSVAADGTAAALSLPVPATDGVAVLDISTPVGWASGRQVTIEREGSAGYTLSPTPSERAWAAAQQPIPVADPRGLRASVNETWLQNLVQLMVGRYGVRPEDVSPTLLAAASPGTDAEQTILVGMTLPSGATVTWASRTTARAESSETNTVSGAPAAAGPGLLDQLVALPLTGGHLAVSGPAAGVAAEVLDRDGALLTTLPLVSGGGGGDVPPPAAATVRVLDASGAVIAEGPLTELGD